MLKDADCLTCSKGQYDSFLILMMLCQLWTLYTTELQHRQMFMNGFEVRLWKLVIACLKVYCQFTNATGNLKWQTNNLTKICSGCRLFTALLLNQTAVGPLSSTPFPSLSCGQYMQSPDGYFCYTFVSGGGGGKQALAVHLPPVQSCSTVSGLSLKWLLLSESSHFKMHVPCFNMRHCDVLMTVYISSVVNLPHLLWHVINLEVTKLCLTPEDWRYKWVYCSLA